MGTSTGFTISQLGDKVPVSTLQVQAGKYMYASICR